MLDEAIVDELVEANASIPDRSRRPVLRAQHPKHHGAVRARFTVLDEVPQELRHGLFARAAGYDALIRFSNGQSLDDRKPDAHGMAIKVFDVHGNHIGEAQATNRPVDFVLVDHQTYFTRTMAEYLAFNAQFSKLAAWRRKPKLEPAALLRLLHVIGGGLSLVLFHRNVLARAFKFASATPASPLASRYWSTTPYRLGAQGEEGMVVHYAAIPAIAPDNGGVAAPDGLSEVLRTHLREGIAAFSFGVALQPDRRRFPIDDPTRDWHEDPANFVPLARIEIPRQDIGADPTQDSEVEGASFTPWNTLEEHRPLGEINEARRKIYAKLSELRQDQSG